jgi:rubrerythrin
MNKSHNHDTILALIKLDLDACRGYEHMLRRSDRYEIRSSLEEFHQDHRNHMERLKTILQELGGKQPQLFPSLHGFFPHPVETLETMRDLKGVLLALRSGERVTNRTYSDALAMDLPRSVIQIVEENYRDEQKHLLFVNNALDYRIWEAQGMVG